MGWRCKIKLTAPATASAARTENKKSESVKRLSLAGLGSPPGPNDGQTCQHHVQYRQREQQLPADSHQLVVAEAGKRAAHPHVEEQENGYLDQEPERALS